MGIVSIFIHVLKHLLAPWFSLLRLFHPHPPPPPPLPHSQLNSTSGSPAGESLVPTSLAWEAPCATAPKWGVRQWASAPRACPGPRRLGLAMGDSFRGFRG